MPPPGYLDALSDAWLRDRARRTWLAEDERGRPLGVLHGTRVQKLPSAHRPADAWFHVSLLFVTEDARGYGIGERLLHGTARVGRDRRGHPGAAQRRAGGPDPLRADGVRPPVGAPDGAADQRPKSALSSAIRTSLPGSRVPTSADIGRAPRRTPRHGPSWQRPTRRPGETVPPALAGGCGRREPSSSAAAASWAPADRPTAVGGPSRCAAVCPVTGMVLAADLADLGCRSASSPSRPHRWAGGDAEHAALIVAPGAAGQPGRASPPAGRTASERRTGPRLAAHHARPAPGPPQPVVRGAAGHGRRATGRGCP